MTYIDYLARLAVNVPSLSMRERFSWNRSIPPAFGSDEELWAV